MNEFILDQPRDDQIDILEETASPVIPKLRTQATASRKPPPKARVSTDNWHQPKDYL